MLMQMQEVFFSIENKHKKSHNHKELKRGGKCVLEWNEDSEQICCSHRKAKKY